METTIRDLNDYFPKTIVKKKKSQHYVLEILITEYNIKVERGIHSLQLCLEYHAI